MERRVCFLEIRRDISPQLWQSILSVEDYRSGSLRTPILYSRCERRYKIANQKPIAKGELFVTHQESGCADRTVAIEYLHWLAAQYHVEIPILVLWDSYSVYRHDELKMRDWTAN
jgi:hypothetical protein